MSGREMAATVRSRRGGPCGTAQTRRGSQARSRFHASRRSGNTSVCLPGRFHGTRCLLRSEGKTAVYRSRWHRLRARMAAPDGFPARRVRIDEVFGKTGVGRCSPCLPTGLPARKMQPTSGVRRRHPGAHRRYRTMRSPAEYGSNRSNRPAYRRAARTVREPLCHRWRR